MPLVVGLLEILPDDHLATLQHSLPDGAIFVDSRHSPGIARAQYVVVRDGTVDQTVLCAAPDLRAIVWLEGGHGLVDEAACRARGIEVIKVRSPSLFSVAEHTVMFALMLVKRFAVATDRLRSGGVRPGVTAILTTQEDYSYNWVGLECFETLQSKRVGLVGIGKIGSAAARLFNAFGSEVIYTSRHSLSEEQERGLGVRYSTLADLLRLSDIVSLHVPFVSETVCLMGDSQFKLMKPTAFFINTARGRLVDESALARALNEGRLSGAALDVFCVEPLPNDSPLLSAPNLLLTPHVGGIPVVESDRIAFTEAGLAVREVVSTSRTASLEGAGGGHRTSKAGVVR